jgi:hypothetical protein
VRRLTAAAPAEDQEPEGINDYPPLVSAGLDFAEAGFHPIQLVSQPAQIVGRTASQRPGPRVVLDPLADVHHGQRADVAGRALETVRLVLDDLDVAGVERAGQRGDVVRRPARGTT